MKTAHFFSHFCSVQHRLALSPQAAALFFFVLGELSASGFTSDSIAMANSRICGTIHISPAALRKCRDELIAAGIIDFSSGDNGKSISLYTLLETGRWKLDVVKLDPASSSAPSRTSVPVIVSEPTPEPAPESVSESVPEPVPEIVPESVSDPVSDPVTVPVAGHVPGSASEPAPVPAPVAASKPRPVRKKSEMSAPRRQNSSDEVVRACILRQKINSASRSLSACAPRRIKLVDCSRKAPNRRFYLQVQN